MNREKGAIIITPFLFHIFQLLIMHYQLSIVTFVVLIKI